MHKQQRIHSGNKSRDETPVLNLRKTRDEEVVTGRRIGTRSIERQTAVSAHI
jgi:hypothetical protein